MPQLMFKGVPQKWMEDNAPALIAELAPIINCPEDWMTLEWCPSAIYRVEGADIAYPIVQVWWFARPKGVQDKVAALLGDKLLEGGFDSAQVSFHLFDREGYYEYE